MTGGRPEGPKGWGAKLEETLIAFILGAMTLITIANVIARYILSDNILWALEVTGFLFAWLVLLGASYAVKIKAHLGIDIVTQMLPAEGRRWLGITAAAISSVFAFLLLKGAWDYWANFANLPRTTGRWFPTGFEETFFGQGYLGTEDTPMLGFLRFLEPIFNDGEAYDKLPRFIPYAVLPFSMALLLWRFLQAGFTLWRGEADGLIASHEVEEALEEAAHAVRSAPEDGESRDETKA